ncbi:hypothetical protein [Xylophilus ampelinus]|uniref:Uncharacterized protein n=1 Tax=Xylophilus ampelinus TaxID=54067 RepID=A0A318SMH5_9BURK|nr:hypothetical protein [Xylophilus ampelinus]MCS4509134.1 hypothetical protein [Xylophilus ampelinus]PYE79838.1 hypothetical protein DFQ15_101158 [Xylophilus ampelinus]
MSITLTYAGTTVPLPADLRWVNELEWQPVAQTAERSITGALVLDFLQLSGGRPITLQGGDDHAWDSRAAMLLLQAWASIAGAAFTLNLRGETFQVVFAREEAALAGVLVVDYCDPTDEHPYCSLALRFLEI